MEAMMRECKACDGTGCEFGVRHHDTRYSVHCPICDCLACDGRGTQSDAMPVSDALADAETLREVVRALPVTPQQDFGALRCAISPEYWAEARFYSSAEPMVYDATEAARAAFRAVPGLRG